MLNRKNSFYLLLSIIMVELFTACSGQNTVSNDPNAAINPSSAYNPYSYPYSIPSVSPSASPSTAPYGGIPPVNSLVELKGPSATYTSAPITTVSILKVTVTSAAPSQIGNTGYTAYYSCLQFNVSVNSETQQVTVSYGNPPNTTGYAYIANPCGDNNVPNSQTLDFSDQTVSGHGTLNVVISQPEYDNCHSNGSYGYGINGSMIEMFYPGTGTYFGGCPMTAVYATHTVSATVAIHTNMTE